VAVRHELSRRELDRAQHATILALARLAERRDMETGQHLERVSAYSRLVAEGLRTMGRHLDSITDRFIEDLACSSPLHDIGKVGIPDSILLKPGRLTPEEWLIMKTHAEIGGSTIDGVIREFGSPGYLRMGSEIAWSHHEKWDGSGYPKGLHGDDIPLSARIVAIADVYDALTTLRPTSRSGRTRKPFSGSPRARGATSTRRSSRRSSRVRDEADSIRATWRTIRKPGADVRASSKQRRAQPSSGKTQRSRSASATVPAHERRLEPARSQRRAALAEGLELGGAEPQLRGGARRVLEAPRCR
jgi:hypothetical protein